MMGYNIVIENSTHYTQRSLRRIAIAAVRSLKPPLDFNKRFKWFIRFGYSRADHFGNWVGVDEGFGVCSGHAYYDGPSMFIGLPKQTTLAHDALVENIARTVRHEAFHWAGYRHKEMNDDDRYCRMKGWPDWLPRDIKLEIKRVKPAKPKPTPDQLAESKQEHAERKVSEWQKKLDHAKRLRDKWKAKARYHERRKASLRK